MMNMVTLEMRLTSLYTRSTTFLMYQITPPDRRTPASRTMEEGVRCSSWTKQWTLQSLFRPDYLVVFSSLDSPTPVMCAKPWYLKSEEAAHDADGWKAAMTKEVTNLKSHNVYDLVPRTPGIHTLRLGWVLHRKFKNGVFEKNKARLVARGNHQRPGID